jgi:hypothetical protein
MRALVRRLRLSSRSPCETRNIRNDVVHIDNKFITDKSQIIDVNIEHLDAKNNILVLRLTRVSSITTDVDVKICIDYDGEEILTCYVLVYDAFLTGAEISIAPISSDVEISVTDSLVEYTADPTNPPNMTN